MAARRANAQATAPSPGEGSAQSAAPSKFYRRQHTVEEPAIDEHEFRPAWRRVTMLDKLLRKDAITAEQYRDAQAFRRLFEAAHAADLSAHDVTAVYLDPDRRKRWGGVSDNSLKAARKLAKLKDELGAAVVELLVMLTVEDLPWAGVARRLRCDPKTAKTYGIWAIRALAL